MKTTTQDLLQRPQILYDSASPLTSNPINNTASLAETSENNNNNYKTELTKEEKDYFSKIPNGYRFYPCDEELIDDYLRNKVENKPLPYNPIIDVNVYQFNPEILTEMFAKFEENGKYYFFTPRDKKYRNGSRPNRAGKDGYWKATGVDKEIKSNDVVVGRRKTLVFYRGKPTCSEKTNWIMQEYCLVNPPQVIKIDENDMKLDAWVLCRIYRTPNRIVKQKRDEKNTESMNIKYNSENNMSLSVDQNNEGLTRMIQINTPSVDQNNERLMRMITTPSIENYNKGLMGMMETSTSMGMLMGCQYIDEEPLYISSDPTPPSPTFFDNVDQDFINIALNAKVFRGDQPLNQYNTLMPCFCGQNQCSHPKYYI